jgi:hypothetical protein
MSMREILVWVMRLNGHASMHRYLQQRRDKQGPHFTYEVWLYQMLSLQAKQARALVAQWRFGPIAM